METKLTGLELREAVAVEVMGRSGPYRGLEVNGAVQLYPSTPGGRWSPEAIPHYETSIQAAWEVVEAMRAKGWMFQLQGTSEPPRAGERWGAFFDNAEIAPPDAVIERVPYGESAPEVICLAALAAIRS